MHNHNNVIVGKSQMIKTQIDAKWYHFFWKENRGKKFLKKEEFAKIN